MTALATAQGFPYWSAQGMILQGWVLVEQGQSEEGIAQLRQGLGNLRATGTEVMWPYFLGLLAQAYGKAGQAREGLALLDEALTLVDKTDARWPEAELYRLHGELLMQQGTRPQEGEAEARFAQALAIARRQGTKALELRAALSLSRLWQQQGKPQDASALLAPVYGWFTEGWATADLQEARTLLDELA